MSNKWQEYLVSIKKELDTHGDSFLKGKTIRHTMHPGNNFKPLAKDLYDYLETNNFDFSSIREPTYGSPIILHKGFSLVTLQSLYNIHLISERFGSVNNFDHIVDIGGGYGNLCKMVFDLGFEGKYTIYDFPEVNEVQKKFLDNTCPTKNIEYKQLQDDWNIKDNSLLIATYSMSEMPIKDREIISSNLEKFKSIFVIYQKAFSGMQNKEYFNSLVENHTEFDFNSTSCSLRKSGITILSGEKK